MIAAAKTCCPKCGLPVNRQGSYHMMAGGQYQHMVCPRSAALDNLPEIAEEAAASAPLVFLTLAETAALLRVSKSTIRNRIRAGMLPARRLRGGQTVLIRQADALALLDGPPVQLAPLTPAAPAQTLTNQFHAPPFFKSSLPPLDAPAVPISEDDPDAYDLSAIPTHLLGRRKGGCDDKHDPDAVARLAAENAELDRRMKRKDAGGSPDGS